MIVPFHQDRDEQADKAKTHRRQAGGAEDVHRPGQVAVEELHRHQVEDDADGPGQVVFRLAGDARMMAHRHLGEEAAVLLGQHRHEAVHLAVERQVLGQVAAHGS